MPLKSQIFSSNGNFTVPANVGMLWLNRVGGGGGGCQVNNGLGPHGGGGAGEFSLSSPLAVNPGDVIAIVVGAPGLGGVGSPNASATAGGSSIVGTYGVLGGNFIAQTSGQTEIGANGATGGGPSGGAGGNLQLSSSGSPGKAESPTCYGGAGGGHSGGLQFSNGIGGQQIGEWSAPSQTIGSGPTPGGRGGCSAFSSGALGGIYPTNNGDGGVGGSPGSGGGGGCEVSLTGQPQHTNGGNGGSGSVVVFWIASS